MQHLPANQVAVWVHRTHALTRAERAAMDAVLSADERARRDRFVFDRDRRDFTAAHALLRTALSRYGPLAASEWRFQHDPHGRPALVEAQAKATDLSFNLSHTEALVVCAIAKATRVGIDAENGHRAVDGLAIAAHFFTPAECLALSACASGDVPARFVEFWTLKEAYIKAIGLGLNVPLNSFGFSFDTTGELRFASPSDDTLWQFWLAATAEHGRLAVAVPIDDRRTPWRISFHDQFGHSAADVTVLRTTADIGSCVE